MIIFFIKTNNGNYGPVEINVIKKLQLNRNALLWNKNLNSWTNAENIPELEDHFRHIPPLINTESNLAYKENEIKKKSI